MTTPTPDVSRPVRTFYPGQLRIAMDSSQLFLDTFDTSLDTTNRWAAPVASGTGAVAAAFSAGQIVLTGGTAANAFSEIHSQPVFIPDEPGWTFCTYRNNIEFPVLANSYRFWGLGQTTGTPTFAAPITDGVGWEVSAAGKLFAVTWAGGARTVIADLSPGSGSGVQPQDGNAHKYYLYFRGDQSFWALDDPDTIVAVYNTGASGPNVNTLPLKILAVSNGGAAATIQVNGVSVGDTARNNMTISDPSLPWRQARVTGGTSAMAVVPQADTSALSNVASSASSVTLLAANLFRKGAVIYNDSTAILFVAYTSTAASATNYTVQVPTQAVHVLPVSYTGQINGIWASANGAARVTELS